MKRIVITVLSAALMVGAVIYAKTNGVALFEKAEGQQQMKEKVSSSVMAQPLIEALPLSADSLEKVAVSQAPQPVISKDGAMTYSSIQKEAIVGLYEGRHSDNPADNIFEVVIDKNLKNTDIVMLSYKLTGLADFAGVSMSVNDQKSMGGYLVSNAKDTVAHNEQLNPAWLRKGMNRFLFSVPAPSYGYRISDLQVRIIPSDSEQPLVVTGSTVSYDNKAYVRGYVTDPSIKVVRVNGRSVDLSDGVFESVVALPSDRAVTVATLSNGKDVVKNVFVKSGVGADYVYEKSKDGFELVAHMDTDSDGSIVAPTASLTVKSGDMKKSMDLSVSSLIDKDMPSLDYGMYNVTDSFSGYRFLPHGELFEGEGATVAMGYDRTKIPSGYTEDDIKTYYFDLNTKHWVALKRDSIDKEKRMILSKTNHFTDMINGIIVVPESPETNGFAPTTMSDLKPANPAEKVQLIKAPAANSQGTANLSYSMEMPPARNGMSPELNIQYNSDGGSGWLGEGWDLINSSITVETRWGVPRYDTKYETETYLLDGVMLLEDEVGLAHRNLNQPRRVEKIVRFFPRKESSFSKIERIGDSPSNYVWNVTSAQGVKYTYGALQKYIDHEDGEEKFTVLGTVKGVPSSNEFKGDSMISEWRITRMEDVHGDYVEYKYKEEEEMISAVGTKAFALYLDSILVGNAGEKPHTVVVFNNRTTKKQIVRSNGRYGYLTSSNQLLDNVKIYFEGKFLRGYTFEYEKGDFLSDLLTKITQLDANENEFNSHKLTYHSMDNNKLYDEGSVQHYTSNESFTDNFFKRFKNKDGFDSKMSMISGAASTDGFSAGGGAVAGVGPVYGGANYSFNRNTTEGKVSLVDINGDGLPDKVVSKGGYLFYQAQSASGFEPERPIQMENCKIDGFSHSTSYTHTISEDVGAGIGPANVGSTFSQVYDYNTTDVYFSDFNNDGLIDIARNGMVYFNRIVDGEPTFSPSYNNTPNPLGNFDISALPSPAETQEEKAKLEAEACERSPLLDVVRVWKAPFAGKVSITGEISLVDFSTANLSSEDLADKPQNMKTEYFDGVKYSIEHNGAKTSCDQMMLNPGENKIVSLVLNVEKGQYVFFRLGSNYQGYLDKVYWNPTITYTEMGSIPSVDEKGNSLSKYNASNDYIIGESSRESLIGPCKVSMEVPVSESENVKKKVYSVIQETITDEEDNESIVEKLEEVTNYQFELFEGESLELYFTEEATSPLWYSSTPWMPQISIDRGEEEPSISTRVAHRDNYNNIVTVKNAQTIIMKSAEDFKGSYSDAEFVDDKSLIQLNNGTGRRIHFCIVQDGKIVFETDDEEFSLDDEFLVSSKYNFVAYSKDYVSSGDVKFTVLKNLKYTDEMGVENVVRVNVSDILTASLYSDISGDDAQLGQLYRGWGQFAIKQSVDQQGKVKPIGLDELKPVKIDLGDADPDDIDPEDIDIESVKNQTVFAMIYDPSTKRFSGGSSNVYVGKDYMCSSRLTSSYVDVSDQIVDYSSMASSGSGRYFAPLLKSHTETHSKHLSAGIAGLGGGGGHSDTESFTDQASMDLNGDGYPDWLIGGSVKYTYSNGSIGNKSIPLGFNQPTQESAGRSGSAGFKLSGGSGSNNGQLVTNVFRKEYWSLSNLAAVAQEKKNVSKSVSANGNFSGSDSYSSNEWYDVNGDGLPDMVVKSGENSLVYLNLGYGFLPSALTNVGEIYNVTSESFGAGLSFAVPLKGSGNISVGGSATFSNSNVVTQLADVNGDGLPDKLKWDKNQKTITAYINNGLGFDGSNSWIISEDADEKDGYNINRTKSTAVTPVNANAGGTFTVGLFVSITPFVNGAALINSTSRTLSGFSDFDGDGLPDLLMSDNEESLDVVTSKVRFTNKLKSVLNPLGGSFNIDYGYSDASYDSPGRKIVMSSLLVSDGVAENGPDQKSIFKYSEGKMDRCERMFCGFGKVNSIHMDINGDVYRQLVNRYDVSDYYHVGNSIASIVCGRDESIRYRVDTTIYNMFTVSDGKSLKEAQPNDGNDKSYISLPLEIRHFAYEDGIKDPLLMNMEKYSYSLDKYGHMETYTFINGTDETGYITSVQYEDKVQEHVYVLGLPTNVSVDGLDGVPYKRTTAEYKDRINPRSMTKFISYIDENTKAETTYKYDNFGNIIYKELPKNSSDQAMSYKYTYDRKYGMYLESVEDAFGYRSSMEDYDYRFGVPLTVRDINGYAIKYELDEVGRVTKIIAPNEQEKGGNDPYTVKNSYSLGTGSEKAYAVTDHYDIQYPSTPMQTVTIVDGFGRVLQVKKKTDLSKVENQKIVSLGEHMTVSGLVVYDEMGRESKTYLPSVCSLNDRLKYTPDQQSLVSEKTYDVLNREVENKLYYDNTHYDVTKSKYDIDNSTNRLVVISTDVKGNVSKVFSDGAGRTTESGSYFCENQDENCTEGEWVPVKSYYDAIGQLKQVEDAGGNLTRYEYDMAGRVISKQHPSIGTVKMTYDNLGNMLSYQTSNMGENEQITYDYDFNHLVEIHYPKHKENDVKYTYGGVNAEYNRVGKVALIEDGSGAQEFYYGRMGEITKIRRTLVIPNNAVATYTAEWEYDTWNRLMSMKYPDGEVVKYSYDLGGNLKSVQGEKCDAYTYVENIGYNQFEQKIYMKYGNGTETFYGYDDIRRRLESLTVHSSSYDGNIMNNKYQFDAMDNIIHVLNDVTPQVDVLGGKMETSYGYDCWSRLTYAKGEFSGPEGKYGSKGAMYELKMGYDKLYNVTSKNLSMSQSNIQFDGTLYAGHTLDYHYDNANPFKLVSVTSNEYKTDDLTQKEEKSVKSYVAYEFDADGNLKETKSGHNEKEDDQTSVNDSKIDALKNRKLLWDDEDHLIAVNDNGYVARYWYDSKGDRVVKMSSGSEAVYLNGKMASDTKSDFNTRFTAYVFPFFVASEAGHYTKHIYMGEQRIVSKLGDLHSFGADPRRVAKAGDDVEELKVKVDYGDKYSKQSEQIKAAYEEFELDYKGEKNDDYVNGQTFCCGGDNMESSVDDEGDNVHAENNVFFYHPDHLGSSSYITDIDGNVTQHIEYIPYGDVFIDEHNGSWETPYFFNAKELDKETGLYYYGARYLNPMDASWLSVDPLFENYAGMSPYNYCKGNPIRYVDPNGKAEKKCEFYFEVSAGVQAAVAVLKYFGVTVDLVSWTLLKGSVSQTGTCNEPWKGEFSYIGKDGKTDVKQEFAASAVVIDLGYSHTFKSLSGEYSGVTDEKHNAYFDFNVSPTNLKKVSDHLGKSGSNPSQPNTSQTSTSNSKPSASEKAKDVDIEPTSQNNKIIKSSEDPNTIDLGFSFKFIIGIDFGVKYQW